MSMTFTGHGSRLNSVSEALDFAYNASLAAVNITKALRKQTNVVR